MLTSQKMKNTTFEKAVFGGYVIKEVDDYREEVSAEFFAIQKENIALKEKIKEINEKMEEYRAVENSMRKALLSAQESAEEMIAEAKAESDNILKEAQAIAKKEISTYRQQIQDEQDKLKVAKAQTTAFILKIREFYKKQSEEIEILSQTVALDTISNPINNNIQDFTLDLNDSIESATKSALSNDEFSITENILEKIKQETLKPKVLSSEEPAKEKIEVKNELEFPKFSLTLDEKVEEKKVEEMPKLNFEEMPKLNFEEMPKLSFEEMPKLNVQEPTNKFDDTQEFKMPKVTLGDDFKILESMQVQELSYESKNTQGGLGMEGVLKIDENMLNPIDGVLKIDEEKLKAESKFQITELKFGKAFTDQ